MTEPQTESETKKKQPKALVKLAFFVIFITCAFFIYSYFNTPRFSEYQIKRVEDSIRSELQKRNGVHVSEVAMIRESDRKLTGFVRLTIDNFEGDLTRVCSAQLSDDSVTYIWRCE
jgi:hypothetical protein